ncbi:MAG: hypothetical protein ACR2LQ_10040 [Acidimicrobiales bacterium]
MQITKLERSNGFLVVDFADARAVGVTRLAPKVLQDGAELLARSITYTFAAFGLQLSGGSAGINAKPESRDNAVSGYLDDVAALVADGSWQTWAGTGMTDEDLSASRGDAARLDDPELMARGAVAAARAALPDASTAAIVAAGPVGAAANQAATAAGFAIDGDAIDAEVDVLLVGGKAGIVDHDSAATIRAKAIVALSPVPVTAKAYATLSRAGSVYVPDFLTLAAPLLAALDPDNGDPVERVVERVGKAVAHGVDAWRAAVDDAEAFLSSWRDELPFGRPLAS